MIFFILCCLSALSSPAQASTVTYDFESLALGSLNGQDNWQVLATGEGASINGAVVADVSSEGLYTGSRVLQADAGGGSRLLYLSRINDGNWSLPFFSEGSVITIEYDLEINYWDASFTLGYDVNDDGHIQDSEVTIGLLYRRSDGKMAIKGPGNSDRATYTFATDNNQKWLHVSLSIDLGANDGAGAVSVTIQNLTDSGTAFSPGSLQDVNLGLDPNAAGSANPTLINGMRYFHDADDPSRLDNLSFTTASAPLPVLWHHFTLRENNHQALLSWSTAQELNNSHFVIERSPEGRYWEALGQVTGKGTTQEMQYYEWTDLPGPGRWHYRLKQVDYDGQYTYSQSLTLFMPYPNGIPLFRVANPAQKQLDLFCIDPTAEPLTIMLANSQGGIVLEELFTPAHTLHFALPNLSSGYYFLSISTLSGRLYYSAPVFFY